MPETNEQSIWMRLFAQVADVLMTVVAFVTGFSLRTQIRTAFFLGSPKLLESYYDSMAVLALLWWFLLDIQKAYSGTRRRDAVRDFGTVVRSALGGTLLFFAISYAMRVDSPPRGALLLFVVFGIGLLSLNRVFFRFLQEFLREGGALTKTILIVGSGEKAQRFLASIGEHSEWTVTTVGFVEFDKERVGREIMGVPVLGSAEDLPRILHEHAIEEVVFAVSTRQLERCTDMLALCEQEGVNAVILSNFFSSLVAQVETEIQYDQPVLIYRTTRHKEWQVMVKRAFDIVFSGAMLTILSPLLLVISVLIKLDDGGPIFYRWKVAGVSKKKFTGYKFRTMVVNADSIKEKLMEKNEMTGIVFKMTNDPRITRVGRFLRKYSLDELPQLWSVLKGDMTIVGPRPPLEGELQRFESWQRRKLSVKPGLTCLWQVSGRSTITDFDEWVRLDLAYIDNWSLWLDFKILLKTVPAVLSGRGAH